MLNDLPVYELYAIRYARRDANRIEHFIGGDPHDGPMPMDYFVWLARCGDHNVVIDTGFTEPVATRRGREFLHCPIDILAALGVAADVAQPGPVAPIEQPWGVRFVRVFGLGSRPNRVLECHAPDMPWM